MTAMNMRSVADNSPVSSSRWKRSMGSSDGTGGQALLNHVVDLLRLPRAEDVHAMFKIRIFRKFSLDVFAE